MKILDFIKFFFISVPLACVLYVTGNIYFETKRLLNGKRA
jgi:hypothetical protein